MTIPRAVMVAMLVSAPATSRPAGACTTFCFTQGDRVVVGKSFDYKIGPGMVFVNKRSVRKLAMPVKPDDRPVRWVSRYASVTFNQNGRELPLSGMNEKGLVVEVMWLQSAKYPVPDKRPTVNELQWVQYHLDTCATVREMIAAAPKVRLSAVYGRLHYLACDRTAACAAFEFVEGKLVIASGNQLRAKTLANSTYAESAAFLARHRGFGGELPVPGSSASLDRFVRASAMALARPGPPPDPASDPVKRAFKILDAVSQGEHSKWNLVYDVGRLRVYFRTYGHAAIKYVDLSRFSPGCATPVKTLDIDTDLGGDVSGRFADYRKDANYELIRKGFGPMSTRFPPGLLRGLAEFPDSLRCGPPGRFSRGAKKQPVSKWFRGRTLILVVAGVLFAAVVAALTFAGQARRKHK